MFLFFHFLCSNVPNNQCHKQKWRMLFFTHINLVAHVLACADAIAHIKWTRLLWVSSVYVATHLMSICVCLVFATYCFALGDITNFQIISLHFQIILLFAKVFRSQNYLLPKSKTNASRVVNKRNKFNHNLCFFSIGISDATPIPPSILHSPVGGKGEQKFYWGNFLMGEGNLRSDLDNSNPFFKTENSFLCILNIN